MHNIQFLVAFLEGSFLTWLKWWNDVDCAAVLTSELFDYGLDVVQPHLRGKKTQEGFEGTYFSSDSAVVFSSFISLLSFDGSETPGQSSPPRWGSCGSTPGPTTPCPRLFAVNRGKTVTKEFSWGNCHLGYSDGAQYPFLSRQRDLTDIHISLKTKGIWPSGDLGGKTVTERSSDKQRALVSRTVWACCPSETDGNLVIQSRLSLMTVSQLWVSQNQTMTSVSTNFKARLHQRRSMWRAPRVATQ